MIEEEDVASIAVAVAPPSRRWVIAGVLVLWIGWGSVYAAMATSAETIPPLMATGVRFVIAGVILGVWGGARSSAVVRRSSKGHWGNAARLGFLNILVGTGGIVVAVKHLPSGTVALLAATAPMWVALVEWVWLRRPVRPRVGVGLLIGFLGAGLLVSQSGAGAVDPLWAIVVILCSGAWGLGMVLASVASQPRSVSFATGMQMVIGGVMMFALAAIVGEITSFSPGDVSARSLIGWVWMLVMGALVGFGVCMWLLRVTSPALVATASYVNPVVAAFVGWAVLGEEITRRSVVSGVLVLVGVVLIVTATRRSPVPGGIDAQ